MKYDLVNFCEIDKYAVKSYCAIHGTDERWNLGDITKINENAISRFNMICGGSPCQDFSNAGIRKGAVWTCRECGHQYNPLQVHYSRRSQCEKCGSYDIDKTRSSLLAEWLRVIRGVRPTWGIYENVKSIVGRQFRDTFRLFEEELREYGYNTYWAVLNARHYGIPQSRERIYLILIRKEADNGKFRFPERLDTSKHLEDILEDTVDEKYYLSEKTVKKLTEDTERRKALLYNADENALRQWRENHPDKEDRSTDIILARQNTKKGYIECIRGGFVNITYPNTLKKGRVIENGLICATITTSPRIARLESLSRIRLLTPLECYRLMGFEDEDFQKAKKAGISDCQLYKQAGNSIVVDVLFYIFQELYQAMPYLFDDIRLSSFFSGIGAFEKALKRLEEHVGK